MTITQSDGDTVPVMSISAAAREVARALFAELKRKRAIGYQTPPQISASMEKLSTDARDLLRAPTEQFQEEVEQELARVAAKGHPVRRAWRKLFGNPWKLRWRLGGVSLVGR